MMKQLEINWDPPWEGNICEKFGVVGIFGVWGSWRTIAGLVTRNPQGKSHEKAIYKGNKME